METRLGVGAAFVDGEFVPGDVAVHDGIVAGVGLGGSAGTRLALPGFVDLQVNGFAGIDFTTAGATDYVTVSAALAATGVTSYQPTLISLPEEATTEALATLAAAMEARAAPGVLGMHLEGPFLAPGRHGAHDPANIVAPNTGLAARLLDAGPVTMVTLAPERDGALGLIDWLVGRGVTVACGHSDASAADAHAAFGRGASVVTHLFNAQRPFSHRDPGVVGAALGDESVVVTLIVDGVHLAPETIRLVAGAAAGRFALITDAIASGGMPDGAYPLGDRTVYVADGEARLEDGTLAGSVLTMDRAVRNLIEVGIGPETAVAAATTVPARVAGRADLGTLAPGTPADVAVVDGDFGVVRTIAAGIEVYTAK